MSLLLEKQNTPKRKRTTKHQSIMKNFRGVSFLHKRSTFTLRRSSGGIQPVRTGSIEQSHEIL